MLNAVCPEISMRALVSECVYWLRPGLAWTASLVQHPRQQYSAPSLSPSPSLSLSLSISLSLSHSCTATLVSTVDTLRAHTHTHIKTVLLNRRVLLPRVTRDSSTLCACLCCFCCCCCCCGCQCSSAICCRVLRTLAVVDSPLVSALPRTKRLRPVCPKTLAISQPASPKFELNFTTFRRLSVSC